MRVLGGATLDASQTKEMERQELCKSQKSQRATGGGQSVTRREHDVKGWKQLLPFISPTSLLMSVPRLCGRCSGSGV